MKSRNYSAFLLVALLGFLLPVTPFLTSCASSSDLAPGGVYAGDATLLNADRVITGSYDVFDTFVKWEYANRIFLTSTPSIKQTADVVRSNGKQLIESASALRDAYKANPTSDGKAKLLNGLAVLQALLNQIAAYYASHLTPPPTSGVLVLPVGTEAITGFSHGDPALALLAR